MSENRLKGIQFSVKEVLHELALDSESNDEPSSSDSSDFGWNSHANVESEMDSVETCSSASTGWHLTQNSSGD